MIGKVENRTDRMIKIKSSIAFVKDLGEICSTIADMKENFLCEDDVLWNFLVVH